MEPIRPPDSTRNECLLGSTSPPRRRRRRGTTRATTVLPPPLIPIGSAVGLLSPRPLGASITWDEDEDGMDHAQAQTQAQTQAGMQAQDAQDEEEMVRLALEVSLQEEHERAVKASLQEEEARQKAQKAERQQKYGLVQSRLRLMRHPSDPLVDAWLELVEQYVEGIPPDFSAELRKELEAWLDKRSRVNPMWNVLRELLV